MEQVLNLTDKAVLGLKHNPELWIATGKNRFDTKWKNKRMRWSEVLGKLQTPTRTQETQSEYFKMSKSEQDNIKDVGGFVGGTLKGGRRKKDSVELRSLLAFDFDHAPQDFVTDLTIDAGYAWAVYSTHKHKPEAPRLRLLVPLDRDVTPDEYTAIMYKMSEGFGMEYLDPSTVQPERLMYWASVSADGEYVFEYNDGDPLKADEILAKYPDWTDASYYPAFPGEEKARVKRAEKQQDPTAKKGLVGAFCRTYDVPAAIATFLSDVYTPDEGKGGRYTFAAGSTHGGLVIYDEGQFCYSNHATDPAHGLDLNSFDLVRIHKFGHLDEDAKEGTPSTRLPSYQQMLDLIRSDKECLRTLDADRQAAAASDFDGETAEAPQEEKQKEWRLELTRDKRGLIEPTLENLQKIFKHDEKLRGIRFNQFSGLIEITDPVPWKKELTEWMNSDDADLLLYLTNHYTVFKRMDIADVLVSRAKKRSFHPVKEYLHGLPEWDGTVRAETIFIDYLGADDTEYVREVARRWLLAAVVRAEHAGAKYDFIPVLSGRGGIGKSTLVNKLGKNWFSDSLSFEDMKDKTAAEKIQGVWINEISELKGMRKMEVESIKSFISRTEDLYRPSYGRQVERHKRGCVFVGTSNAEDYLKDITGNRRFLPINCHGSGRLSAWDMTQDTVDQIWAEMWYYYDFIGDHDLVLPKHLAKIAEDMQTGALERDERLGLVQVYLERELPWNWSEMDLFTRREWLDTKHDREPIETPTKRRETVSVMEIWAECFKQNPNTKKRADSDDIIRILLQLGWHQCYPNKIPIYGTQRLYKPRT